MRDSRRLVVMTLAMIFLMTSVGTAGAEDIQAQTGTLPAPADTPFAMALGAPPDPQAERDRRGNALRDHHLPGPSLQALPPGVLAGAAPSATMMAELGAPDVVIYRNQVLGNSATNGVTSHVLEPAAAARGQEVLVTGNWFAAFSTDGGANFSYVNPATTFPGPPGQSFCCDQLAIYDSAHDLMIWYLQYIEDGSGNTGRVAVAQGADIQSQQWRYYDFTPQNVGNWSNEWFDYPALALGDDYLYVTTNTFTTSPYSFTRAVVLRIPLDELAAYQALSYEFFDVSDGFSLRPTLGATDNMYFGSHVSLNTIRVFKWPENSSTVSTTDIGVELWSNANRVAPGPDGRDWLGRADHRMTGGWLGGGTIGFAWTASQDSNYPFPHVRVAMLDEGSLTLQGQPHLWHDDFAFAYPAVAPNDAGEIGISVSFGGGGQFYPSHAVGVLRRPTMYWRLMQSAYGTHGPSSNKWGDYLSVLPHGGDQATWVASGFTLQAGAASSFIEPRFVHFGFEDGIRISLVNEEPDKRLRKGEQLKLRAEVTVGGNPIPGIVVTFSSESSLATVPSSATTNDDGEAFATVTGQSKYEKAEVTIHATADGRESTAVVLVPDLSTLAFILTIGLMLLAEMLYRRAS